MSKRFLSIALVLSLVFSSIDFSTIAYAAEDSDKSGYSEDLGYEEDSEFDEESGLSEESEENSLAEAVYTEGDFDYTTYDELEQTYAEITGYHGAGGNVEIPQKIAGYQVTAIGDSAFINRTDITGIKLPEGIEALGGSAFENTAITSIFIPKTLTKVYSYGGCFKGCTELKTIELEEGLTVIPQWLFVEAESLESITIPATVTSIEEYAFWGCTGLTSVKLSEGLETIGMSVFYGCTGLTNIELPDSVKSIGDCAFLDCTKLQTVNLPKNLEKLGRNAFENTAIESITIPKSLKDVDYGYCFKDCANLKTIAFEEGITQVPANLFLGAESIESVTIPETVTTIEEYAFQECTGLKSVRFSEGLETIEKAAFNGCSALTDVEIPDSIKSIGDNAFYDCTKLETVKLSKNLEALGGSAFGNTAIKSVFIPKTLTKVYSYGCCFKGCTELKTIELEEGLTVIPQRLFEEVESLESITIPATVTSIEEYAFWGCTGLTSVKLSEGLETIGQCVFYGCTGLTKLELPDSVKSIGDFAFCECTNLKTINLPKSLEKLGRNAFQNTAIDSVTIPKGLKDADNGYCFKDCANLKTIEFEEGITQVPANLFLGAESIESVTIPETVTTIEEYAFQECTGLKSVRFSEGLETIEKAAFYGCSALTDVEIPDSVKSIDDNAFYDCTKLETVKLSKNLEALGGSAFGNTTIKSVFIPKTLTKVYSYGCCFKGCADLKTVELEEGLTVIPQRLFEEVESLESITIPATVTSIEEYAFWGCTGLTSVKLFESLETIGQCVFYGCTGLTKLELPDSVKSIGDLAFCECTNLKTINLPKSLEKLGRNAFQNTAIDSVTIPKGLKDADNGYCFKDCANLKTIEFEEGITQVPANLFLGAESIESVTIPETVTTIEEYAFQECTGLKSVRFSEGLETIEKAAFYGCSALTDVEIPDSVKSIDDNAFYDCTKLETVKLSKNLEALGGSAFGNTAIKSVFIPKTLTKVYSYGSCFNGCSNLKTVELEEGIKVIPEYLFWGAESIDDIILPNSVESIGDFAFGSCSGLTKIQIPDSVTSIGERAFMNDSNVVFYCSSYSYAAIYAINHDIALVEYGEKVPSRRVLKSGGTYYYLQTKDSFRGTVAFEIADDHKEITDRILKVAIPVNSTLDESTIMLDGNLCQNFIYENQILEIPVSEDKAILTFDMVRQTLERTYSYALLSFKENGKDGYEVIDVIGDEYVGISINADQTVSRETFNVEGTAPVESTVKIYINDAEAGTCKASKAGNYSCDVTIASPQDESVYTVKAESTVDGETYSDSTEVIYSASTPEITEFQLYYNSDTGYDLLNESKVPTITFKPSIPCTFVVDITKKEELDHVYVTSLRNNEKRVMEAVYDKSSDRYVASGYFDDSDHSYVPGTLRVEFQKKHEKPLVQDVISSADRAKMARIKAAFSDTTVRTIKQSAYEEEYVLDVGESLVKKNQKLIKVGINCAVSTFSEDLGKSVDEFLGMSQNAFMLASRVVEGANNKKYYAALDTSDPTAYTLLVKDATSTANSIVKMRLALETKDDWTWADDIAPTIGAITKAAGLIDDYAQTEKGFNDRRREILQSTTIKDKEWALRMNEKLRSDQHAWNMAMFAWSLVPGLMGLSGPLAIGFTALTVLMNMGMEQIWEQRIAEFMGRGRRIKWAIDPSGYIYSQVYDNRLENVKVTVLYKEKPEDPDGSFWDASEYDQFNPLYSDSDGKYAWDVPEGYWQVMAELEGYETAYTDWMEVPPPRTDVAIRMVSKAAPELLGAKAGENCVTAFFDQYIDPETIGNIILKDESGQNVGYTVNYEGALGDGDKLFAKEFKLFTENYSAGSKLTITVPSTVISADNAAVTEKTLAVEEASVVTVDANVSVKMGETVTAGFEVTNYKGQEYSAKSNTTFVATVESVEIKDGKGQITIQGNLPGETTVDLYDANNILCGSVTVQVLKPETETPDDPENPDDPEDDRGDIVDGDLPDGEPVPEGLWAVVVANPEAIDGTYSYTGKQIKPQIRVYDGKRLLKSGKDYTLSYANNTKAYTLSKDDPGFYNSKGKTLSPAVIVTGKGNYSGKETVYFKIIPIDISEVNPDIYCDSLTVAVSKKAQKPVSPLNFEGKVLKNKTDYNVVYYAATDYISMDEPGKELSSVSDSGEYIIRYTGKGNYAGVRDVNLTVADPQTTTLVSKLTFSKIAGQEYDEGKEIKPSVTVKDKSKVLVANTENPTDYDYSITYENNKAVGTAYAVIKGNPEKGYRGTKRIAFKIVGFSLKNAQVTGLPALSEYTGSAFEKDIKEKILSGAVSLKVKNTGKVLAIYNEETGTGDYKVSCDSLHAGKATVTFTGINGCTGTVTKTFKITPYSLNGDRISVTAEATACYEKTGAKAAVTVKFEDKELEPGKDYTVSYKNNTKAGNIATILLKGKGDFKDTFSKRTLIFAVEKQELTKLDVEAADVVYQNKPGKFTTKVTITDTDGKVLKAGTDYEKAIEYRYSDNDQPVDKNATINAGTVLKVIVTGKGNYTGSATATYRITNKSIASAKIIIPAQKYTGKKITLKESDITVKIGGKPVQAIDSDSGTVNWQIVETSYKNNINKGKASVTIQGLGNYGGTKTQTFIIREKGFLWWR